jgi:hypothetical protein
LKANLIDLIKKGKGSGPKTADPIDDEEINILYEKKSAWKYNARLHY